MASDRYHKRHNPYSARTTKYLKFIGSGVEWVNRLYLIILLEPTALSLEPGTTKCLLPVYDVEGAFLHRERGLLNCLA